MLTGFYRFERPPVNLALAYINMKTEWNKLIIDISDLDCERLLSDWRWLVDKTYQPFLMTIFGDWFMESPNGSVFMLDLVSGQLNMISQSISDFDKEKEKLDNLDEWFMADLSYLCHDKGLCPGVGQCLSYKIPPILSGELIPENIDVADIMVHQSIMGQIHMGVKDLPEGTKINKFLVDGEEP